MNDLISRQAAIKAIDDLPNCYNGYSDTYDKECIIGVLEELPTVEPNRGEWETVDDWDGDCHYQCSSCGEEWFLNEGTPSENDMNYCPNCGAKMERSEG